MCIRRITRIRYTKHEEAGMVRTIPRRRKRVRQYAVIITTLIVVELWAVTIVVASRPGQRLRQRIAEAVLGIRSCDERAATIVGTNGDDILKGTPGADVIVGLDGNDMLYGNGGNDRLCGNQGDDTLYGADGADVLVGNEGADVMHGYGGGDILRGGPGNDDLFGDEGDDDLFGGEDDDDLFGGPHSIHDSCYGGSNATADTASACEVVSNVP
jgi:Ca2+-binding RTX toxin-like protein